MMGTHETFHHHFDEHAPCKCFMSLLASLLICVASAKPETRFYEQIVAFELDRFCLTPDCCRQR
jgi:hypothetical protein